MQTETFPRLERGCLIEVPRPDRRGRPSYSWVQGWVVKYNSTRESMPMRLDEARDELHKAKQRT